MQSNSPNTLGTVRFVVLRHEEPHGTHYDLMIETGPALATWRCPHPPEQSRDTAMPCTRIADHRPAYLEYEGPISNNRGYVTRHDAGTCLVQSIAEHHQQITFTGTHLQGRYQLIRQGCDDASWLLRPLGL